MREDKRYVLSVVGHLDGYDLLCNFWKNKIAPFRHRRHWSTVIILALFLLGIVHPTSWHGEILVLLRRSSIYFVNILLFLLLLMQGLGGRNAYRCAVGIPIILFLATLLSPLPDIRIGAYIFFLPLSLLFCLNLREVQWSKVFPIFFIAVNCLLIILAIAVLAKNKMVIDALMSYYNAYLDHMLRNMIIYYKKPVSFFASHAIASFMYLFFILVNIIIFFHCRNYLHLFFALCFTVCICYLRSNGAYFSLLIAFAIMIFYLLKDTEKYKSIYYGIAVVVLAIFFSYFFIEHVFPDLFMQWIEQAKAVMQRPGGGFLGRYTSHGVLAGNIDYILKHPFSPVGLRNSEQFWFMDSGPVEYMLRGSIPLVLVIYFGFYSFLRFHLSAPVTVFWIFCIVLVSELGFPYLKYFRFMALLPFMIVYLRHAELSSLNRNATTD